MRHFNFRMHPDTLRALVQFLNPKRRGYRGGCKQMTNSKMVAMTLNYLGSLTTVRQLARQYGVMTDCFIRYTEKVMRLLMENCHKVIKWPERDEYAMIAANFDKSRVW